MENKKQRTVSESLYGVLDEIQETLQPLVARVAAPKLGDRDSVWAANVLSQMKTSSGCGLEALQLMDPAVANGVGTVRNSKLPLLDEWIRSRSHQTSMEDCVQIKKAKERFVLLGILFSPRSLVPRLAPLSSDNVLFPAACRALTDLDRLEHFDKRLKQDIASNILSIPMPKAATSCRAYVHLLGAALLDWAAAEAADTSTEPPA